MTCYPQDSMYEEMSFIAYYFHWSHAEIMNLDHRTRRRWCNEITRINKKLNNETEKKSIFDI
ncbi:hypothetical protein F9B85_10375 [Heliorestis acidaminivorans]|uniref:DUF6760 domain-containing protein n=1 Tax=Heliorestis acidaminivorans TaxID=553427 RepID=A0A6I0ERB3_9FIRM|nr:hypothetical protein F9B85_10375 [Heliorestis acidaminivorans]